MSNKQLLKCNLSFLVSDFIFLYQIYLQDKKENNPEFLNSFTFKRMENRVQRIIEIFKEQRIDLDADFEKALLGTEPEPNVRYMFSIFQIIEIILEKRIRDDFYNVQIHRYLRLYSIELEIMEAEFLFSIKIEEETKKKDGMISWVIMDRGKLKEAINE